MNALAIAATPPTTTPMIIWVVLSLGPWSSSEDGECKSARVMNMLKRAPGVKDKDGPVKESLIAKLRAVPEAD